MSDWREPTRSRRADVWVDRLILSALVVCLALLLGHFIHVAMVAARGLVGCLT